MKKFISNKLSWIGAGCLVLAIIFAIMQSITTPENSLVSKMGSAIENKDLQKYLECYAEEDRADAEIEFNFIYFDEAMGDLEALYGDADAQASSNVKIERVLLQGETVEGDDGTTIVPVTMVIITDGEVSGSSDSNVVIYEDEVTGTKYIR